MLRADGNGDTHLTDRDYSDAMLNRNRARPPPRFNFFRNPFHLRNSKFRTRFVMQFAHGFPALAIFADDAFEKDDRAEAIGARCGDNGAAIDLLGVQTDHQPPLLGGNTQTSSPSLS